MSSLVGAKGLCPVFVGGGWLGDVSGGAGLVGWKRSGAGPAAVGVRVRMGECGENVVGR